MRPTNASMIMKQFLTMGALCGAICTTAQPGSLDASFNYTGYHEFSTMAIAVQPDGNVLIGAGSPYLRRLTPSGAIDPTFTYNAIGGWEVRAIEVLPDGKVLVAGNFTSIGGVALVNLARLNSDGSVDGTFVPGVDESTSQAVTAMALQADGKILAGGLFYEGVDPIFKVVRFHSDGVVDTTFQSGTGMNYPADVQGNPVEAIAVQPDGKILIAGRFTTYDGATRRRVARVHSDGTLDTSFDPGFGGNNAVFDIALQPDGKIILGGYFTSFNTQLRDRIVRLNTDGTVDVTYGVGVGFSGGVEDIELMPDGRVLAGGYFWSVDGVSRNYIARLEPDGTLDEGFDPGLGCDVNVRCLKMQADGKIMIGGAFNTVDGVFRRRIARLNGNGTNAIPDVLQPGQVLQIHPNPTTDLLYCSDMLGVHLVSIVDMFGRLTTVQFIEGVANVSHLPQGTYVLILEKETSVWRAPFIKL